MNGWETLNRRLLDIAPLSAALEPTHHGPIQDPSVFVTTLGEIGGTLRQAGLPLGFNRVYYHLSQEVLRATGESTEPGPRFNRPDDVRRTMSIFGEFWFQPLRQYVQLVSGNNDVLQQMTPAWREALDPGLVKAEPGIQFTAGMIAHICGRDLASSLYLAEVKDDYHPDYTHVVQQLIGETTKKLSSELIPGHSLIRGGIQKPLVAMIGQLREVAWRNAGYLQNLPSDKRERFLCYLDNVAASRIRRLKKCGGALLKVADLTNRNQIATP